MAVTDFRQSELWQSALGPRDNDPHARDRERLRNVYGTFWERGIRLAQKISTDLPGLTLHDEAHFTALWGRASQLAGPRYNINPLEVFIFGGAVLLHDIGHAVAAYEGGRAELEKSPQYRDAVAAILRQRGENPPREEDIVHPPPEITEAALFVALRRLHPCQAEIVAARSFDGSYLIDDSDIRNNLSQLIGRIAASHHWDRTSLDQKLGHIQGAPGSMPQEWTIRPVLIAALLRCADAIQIDQTRAPAFARALQNPQGQSRLHWLAQQLAQPIIKIEPGGGPGALLFTSQRDFEEAEADAWWIAYDLVRNANEELQGCYQLMKELELPVFTVDRVAGAESPRQLERYIRAYGWRPVNAEVRVSNVEHIVNLFGGRLLYGHDPSVPLRELIQNASDAVRARHAIAKDPFYRGMVLISLKKLAQQDAWHLIVEDDGIGMSEAVLTGPLIKFGDSFLGLARSAGRVSWALEREASSDGSIRYWIFLDPNDCRENRSDIPPLGRRAGSSPQANLQGGAATETACLHLYGNAARTIFYPCCANPKIRRCGSYSTGLQWSPRPYQRNTQGISLTPLPRIGLRCLYFGRRW